MRVDGCSALDEDQGQGHQFLGEALAAFSTITETPLVALRLLVSRRAVMPIREPMINDLTVVLH